jgi:hypothetical protein
MLERMAASTTDMGLFSVIDGDYESSQGTDKLHSFFISVFLTDMGNGLFFSLLKTSQFFPRSSLLNIYFAVS